jgi:2-dehydropantoate 2-reductase
MRIGVVGAGAVGGWIGISLAAAGRHELSAFARGATLAALRAGPWQMTTGGKTLAAKVKASDNPRELGEQDVVVIALKGPALESVAPLITPLIGEKTVVIPTMNGVPWWFLLGGGGELPSTRLSSVDPRGAIAGAIPFASVLGCVVHASASSPAPGLITHKAGNRLIFGEPDGSHSARLNAIADLFRSEGFEIEVSGRIQRDIWYKLWGNMTMNPISAIAGVTCDRILDDPLVNDFVLRIMHEAAAVGAKIGCLIEERGEDRNKVTRRLGAFKTSMLQDVEGGRPLEIDHLLGAPREIAEKLHIPTPNMDALLGLTRLFARNRGLYPDILQKS